MVLIFLSCFLVLDLFWKEQRSSKILALPGLFNHQFPQPSFWKPSQPSAHPLPPNNKISQIRKHINKFNKFSLVFMIFHMLPHCYWSSAHWPFQSPRTQALRCGLRAPSRIVSKCSRHKCLPVASGKIIQKWGEIIENNRNVETNANVGIKQRGEQQISTNWNLDLIDDHFCWIQKMFQKQK